MNVGVWFVYMGLLAIVTFVLGVVGYSRRAVYVFEGILLCGLIFLFVSSLARVGDAHITVEMLLLNAGAIAGLLVVRLMIDLPSHWVGRKINGRP